MVALVKRLSEQFDFVLFDSPPMLAAPDAMILAMLAQGTLLVFSPDRTSRKAARRTRDGLRSRQDVHVIGVAEPHLSGPLRIYTITRRRHRSHIRHGRWAS
jgi:Mrp family chromosome partitioning ATPase